MARVIASHLTPEYAARVMAQGDDRWNGAWFYSEEILRGIVPVVRTSGANVQGGGFGGERGTQPAILRPGRLESPQRRY